MKINHHLKSYKGWKLSTDWIKRMNEKLIDTEKVFSSRE